MCESYWLGVKTVQIPENLQAYQEIIWEVKPSLIIETGIKYGGSLVFSASMLAILEACGEVEDGRVIGIDIKDRKLKLPLGERIRILIGSSIDEKIIRTVKRYTKRHGKIMVFLDSNHSHDHVLAELIAYAPLVSVGSYIVVNDTGLEDLLKNTQPTKIWIKRGWVRGSNPKTAVWEFLKTNDNFEIDKRFTGHPDGFLKRIR